MDKYRKIPKIQLIRIAIFSLFSFFDTTVVFANSLPIIDDIQSIQMVSSALTTSESSDPYVINIPWGFPAQPVVPVINLENETSLLSDVTTDITTFIPNDNIPFQVYPVSLFTGIEIVPQEHPQTVVSNIYNFQGYGFVIETTSPISNIEHFVLYDNRFVIDVKNAVLESDTTLAFDGLHPIVRQIRMARQEGFSRVVFDMYAVSNYNLFLSPDRTRLYVEFIPADITNIWIARGENNDYITIEANNIPAFNISYVFTDMLVIDLPLSSLPSGFSFINSENSNFGTNLQIEQLNNFLVRITIRTESVFDHSYFFGNNSLTIRLSIPTFRNMEFNRSNSIISLTDSENVFLTLNDIVVEHYYRNLNHIFRFNRDLSEHFGYGIVQFHSEYSSTIEIFTENNVTQIIINGPNIAYAELIQTELGIAIRTFSPREVYDFIVMLDPGHGGIDPGAVHFGFRESHLVLEISNMLYQMLEQRPNIGVFATRMDDSSVSLAGRAEIANNVADLFVSIHMNAFSTANPHGTETYWLPHDEEYRWPLSRLEIAYIFHNNLLRELRRFDRGVRTANFAVLRLTDMPSVLLELGFMSNYEEMRFLGNPANLPVMANAIYISILEVYELTR